MCLQRTRLNSKNGFTLIELLIVVAIIAVLAAIAVPNFLEAMTRSRVARVQSDLRTIATGVEVYRVDHNSPPIGKAIPGYPVNESSEGYVRYALAGMTSPVAYLSSLPSDPFAPRDIPAGMPAREVGLLYHLWRNHPGWAMYFDDPGWGMFRHCVGGVRFTWALHSQGPAGPLNPNDYGFVHYIPYDSTNGTVSLGNLTRAGV